MMEKMALGRIGWGVYGWRFERGCYRGIDVHFLPHSIYLLQ